jgi:WD40 repeat protein/energy-coupling factor transporter ATP-binding protein EcfA2
MSAQPQTDAIQTSGGAYVEGSVTAQTFIGRDQYVGYTFEQVQALIAEIRRPDQPKTWDGREPYVGLEAFQESDANLFFGREKLVDDLVEQVRQSRFICITGPSGSGKSSLARAGLIHALKRGAISGSDKWLYETLTPRNHPLEQLATAMSAIALRADMSAKAGDFIREKATTDPDALSDLADVLARGSPEQRVVLLIDQFEEVFTQTKDENERRAFLTQITGAPRKEGGRVTVVIAMRSDFVSQSATYPSLRISLSGQFQLVGAMEPEELARAIALPALEVGAQIEPKLVSQLITDMKGEPGALPLMQFTLKDLFDSQPRRRGEAVELTLADYLKRGGIQQALERHADTAFKQLNEPGQQDIARHIFSQLIEVGHGTVDTRRTATFEELVPAGVDPVSVETVVQVLSAARLITTDTRKSLSSDGSEARTVTLAHETLIEAWPWLKRLVNEGRAAIALQNEISEDAAEWDKHRRDTSYLYVGARLQTAQEQLAANKIKLNALAQEFVDAGIGEQQAREHAEAERRREKEETLRREAEQARLLAAQQEQIAEEQRKRADVQERMRKRLFRLLIGLATLFVVAVIAAAIAYVQYRNSKARQLAAQAITLSAFEPDTALLLAVEALNTQVTPLREVYNSLQHTTQCCASQLAAFLRGHDDRVWSVAFNHDENKPVLASASDDGTVILWDVNARVLITQMAAPKKGVNLHALAFSPDDKLLATPGSGDTGIVLWDVNSRQVLTSLVGHSGSVFGAAFNRDGTRLASGGADGRVLVWDISNIHAARLITSQLQIPGASRTWVWNVAFSPDGKTLASAGQNGSLQLWDYASTSTSISSTQVMTGIVNAVAVAFSPDSRLLATGHTGGNVRLWDLQPWTENHSKPTMILTQTVHDRTVWGLAFSRDGRLATGSETGRVHFWKVDTSAGVQSVKLRAISSYLDGHARGIFRIAFNASGTQLAAGSLDGLVSLWNVSVGDVLIGHRDEILSLHVSPDGQTLSSISRDGQLIAWDVASRTISNSFTLTSTVSRAVFSPDGRLLATDAQDRALMLWRAADGKLIQSLSAHSDTIRSLAFSHDGKRLASGSSNGEIMLWDVGDIDNLRSVGKPILAFVGKGRVTSLAFSPDGSLLAAGGCGSPIVRERGDCGRGEFHLYRMSDPSRAGEARPGPSGYVTSLAFSRDGKCLAVGSDDNKIDLQDLGGCVRRGRLLTLHTDTITTLQFTSDGQGLVSGSEDADVLLWSLVSGQPSGQPFGEHNGPVTAVALNADSTLLFSAGRDNNNSGDRTIVLHDLTFANMQERACRIANRNLTPDEWGQYVGTGLLEPYHKSCPNLP